jgi:hypothetical protein
VTFLGAPPFLPFSRAAAALASERTLPPLRPRETAAGFLRGTALLSGDVAVDVLLRQGGHSSQRKGGNLRGQGLEQGDVASFQGGVAAGHHVAAVGVHERDITEPLGLCQVGISTERRRGSPRPSR